LEELTIHDADGSGKGCFVVERCLFFCLNKYRKGKGTIVFPLFCEIDTNRNGQFSAEGCT
jgi:hypothetical protein